MDVINKPIAELIPYVNNPRNNDAAVDAVASSIAEFGFKQPIVIDKDGVVVCGHTRLKAAKKLGLEEAPCVVADDLTPAQIKAYRLADNKVAEAAEWNDELLELELLELEDFGIDMSGFGFEAAVMADDYDTDFELPDGDKPEICTMTFTLHEEQKGLIEFALNSVKDDITETFGNMNKNGNALYEVVRQWAELKK